MVSRPPSIWLFQIITTLVGIALGLLEAGLLFAGYGFVYIPPAALLITLAAMIFFFVAAWSAIEPKPWAKWSSIVALLIIVVVLLILPVESGVRTSQLNLANDAQRGGALIARAFEVALILWLTFRLAVGEKAKMFWARCARRG